MSTRTVMVVDDEPELREMVGLVLEHMAGWKVILASSCDEALVLGAAQPLDAILLDVNMPGRDGPATYAALRATPWANSVPIAFLTAAAGPSEVAVLRRLGATGVVPKPFDPMTLVDQVSAALRW